MTNMNACYLDLVAYAFSLCAFIPLWVFLILAWQILSGKGVSAICNEYNVLEFAWTFAPSVAVFILCCFNVRSVWAVEEDKDEHELTALLIVGNQWYWNYSIAGEEEGGYDSIMLDFIDSVDKPLRVCVNTKYELLVSSADVIHSFSLPTFNVKIDGIPGRVNSALFFPTRLGVFVGYCSELCGAGHAYMPIVVEVVESGLKF